MAKSKIVEDENIAYLVLYSLKASDRYQDMLPGVMTERTSSRTIIASTMKYKHSVHMHTQTCQ